MAAKTVPVTGEFVPPIADSGMLHVAKVTVGSPGSTGKDIDVVAGATFVVGQMDVYLVYSRVG